MNNNPFICHFQLLYQQQPLFEGLLCYGGNFTREKLLADNKVLGECLNGLNKVILNNLPSPVKDAFESGDVSIVTFLPDLIN